ncbi:MAG: GHKL domain-containing protein [Lachnospiraceae bacterium]|jgi:hypothetical protein|nr:GHKL domain-containing protein [Lachnospiraceae bacterium]
MKKNFGYFLLTILLTMLLCGIFTYLYLQSQSYLTVQQGGESVLMSREEAKKAKEILSSCSMEEYASQLIKLREEKEKLQEYREVLVKSQEGDLIIYNRHLYLDSERNEVLKRYHYSVQQADSDLKVLTFCMEKLRYAVGYDSYIKLVKNHAEEMMSVRLFTEGTKNKIIQTVKDFYGLENVKVVAAANIGVEQLFHSYFSTILSVFCVFLCSGIFLSRYRRSARDLALSLRGGSGIGIWTMVLFFGCIGIFMAEAFAVELSIGLEDISRPIQSMQVFRTSPFMMSVGLLLGIWVFFRCAAVLLLFLLIVGLFTMEKKWLSVLLGGGLLILEIFLEVKKVPYSLHGLFHVEKLWGTYDVALFLDKPILRCWILSLLVFLLFLTVFFFAASGLKTALLVAREQAEQRYFEEVDEKNAEARMLRHDMNNHLAAVAMLLQEKKTEDAKEYLRQVMEGLEATKPPVRTGIGVLDGVLMAKETAAKEKGIRMTMEFEGGMQGCMVPDHELCSLFGNLLDNCVEACERLPQEKRWAKLKVNRQMEMVCVFCENPYDEIKREGGKLVTQKADSKNHGLGIRQMERIVKKHGGTMEIETENNVFSVSILLPEAGKKA